MLSMVAEDTEDIRPLEKLPHFTVYLEQDKYTGDATALFMNAWIFEILAKKKPADHPIMKIDSEEFLMGVNTFLMNSCGTNKATLAGKNVASFDFLFLPPWMQEMFRRRMIDPGSVFLDFKDNVIKDMATLKKDLKLDGIVTHNAYEDALDVIRILRTKYT